MMKRLTPFSIGMLPFAIVWAAGFLVVTGCAARYVIPESFTSEMDRAVLFSTLLADPDAHQGEIIPLGGLILKARNLKEGTQIEVLHLPLDRYDRPVGRLTESQGRFLVIHPGYLETAVLQKGQRITVVGEVIGKKDQFIDEVEYTYPYLKAQFVHIWPRERGYAAYPNYPHPYPYGYYPYGYYPWRSYWYDPWGPPVLIVPDGGEKKKKRRFNPGQTQPPPSSKGLNRQLK